MKLKLLKNCFLPIFVCISVLMLAGGCKKDQITVDQVKEYEEVGHKSQNVEDSPFRVTLNPNGSANVLPTGDIVYGGTYKISGDDLTIKTDQNSGSYSFDIVSKTEIKEKKNGTVLKLKQ